MALHASKSRAIKHISAVSSTSSLLPNSALFLQPHTSNGYDQHSTGIRCRQGDDITQFAEGCWYNVSAVTIGSSGLCCSISLCKSVLGSGAPSHGLTVVMQVISYAPLLIRWPCISLPSRPLFHMLPSFLIPLRAFDTFALLFATRLSKIHTITFKRYSPSGHLTLAPHSRRRWTLLLTLVIFIYMSSIFPQTI
jgi:hypothetical protein